MTSHDQPLSEHLRAATADAHDRAEHAPFVQDLLAGRLPVDGLVRLGAQYHAVYGVLEDVVASNGDPQIAPFLAPELARLPALTADLEHLAGFGWRDRFPVLDSTRAYCARLRAASTGWPGGLLAHHYVRYMGDLSGGQVVGRVLQRIYGFEDGGGTEFFRFPQIPSPKQFKDRYRELLDALPWDASRRQRLVDEANVAFELNTDVFYELAPTAILATQVGDTST